MAEYIGDKLGQDEAEKLEDFEKRVDPNDKDQQALLEEMRQHLKKVMEIGSPCLKSTVKRRADSNHIFRLKSNWGHPLALSYVCARAAYIWLLLFFAIDEEALQDMKKNEDPRLSFSTPEFKEAQRQFTDNFKKNFGRPIEWGLVKDYPWSTPQLRKLDVPVDINGKPWPLDQEGKPIVSQ